jgi:predicted RNA-binding Zn-ribbon protein involved in translation (DUF1610 family)
MMEESNSIRILYDSIEEYNKLCNDFKNELPELIRNNNIDDWTYMDYPYLKYGLHYSACLNNTLHDALKKLTKNQNNNWVNNIIDILECAIRGLAKSIEYIDNFDDYIECDECGNEEIVVNFQAKFKEREICNIMIINIINGILFCGDTDGSTLSGGDNFGQMEKIAHFECNTCNKFFNRCDICDENNIDMCYNCYKE